MDEEFQSRLSETNGMHEDEVENLQADLMDLQSEMHGQAQDFEHQLSLKDQKIENYETHIEELKFNLK